MVASNSVSGASSNRGVKTACAPEDETVPSTTMAPGPMTVKVRSVRVFGFIPSEKVTLTLRLSATLMSASRGAVVITKGASVSATSVSATSMSASSVSATSVRSATSIVSPFVASPFVTSSFVASPFVASPAFVPSFAASPFVASPFVASPAFVPSFAASVFIVSSTSVSPALEVSPTSSESEISAVKELSSQPTASRVSRESSQKVLPGLKGLDFELSFMTVSWTTFDPIGCSPIAPVRSRRPVVRKLERA